jgi:hypothetical protein
MDRRMPRRTQPTGCFWVWFAFSTLVGLAFVGLLGWLLVAAIGWLERH